MSKENSWFPGRRHSSEIPASAPAEGNPIPPIPLPPDPPDLTSSYLSAFPPLSPASTTRSSPPTSQAPSPSTFPITSIPPLTTPLDSSVLSITPVITPLATDLNPRSEIATVPNSNVLPITTDPSSDASTSLPTAAQSPQHLPITLPSSIPPPLSTVVTSTPLLPQPSAALTTWAAKLKKAADKSLSRLTPLVPSSSGPQKLVIPDHVFQAGAQLHRNFIVGKFLGRPPAFTHIQNVLSSMWNKGAKLEIHLNPHNRSILVRIPNDYIRCKVLEKKVWHVSESMFYVYPWSPGHSASINLEAIPVWAHISGIPLELMHHSGWSYLAGQIGEPKEVDDFTLNLVSLDTAHIKVEADLNKPLPTEVEYFREDGSVYKVPVTYPWTPPSCSHCHELGHILRYCHQLPPSPPPPKEQANQSKKSKAPPPPKEQANQSKKSSGPKPLPNPPLSTPPISNPSPPIALHPSNPLTPANPPIPAPPIPPSLPHTIPPPLPSSSSPATSAIDVPQSLLPLNTSLSCPPLSASSNLNQFSILASLPSNSSIPTKSDLPFFPSSNIPFFPGSPPNSPTHSLSLPSSPSSPRVEQS